jgi:hypothetical protein
MTIKANKGEWSEFYAFLKILDEKKLFAADKNLQIIPDKFFVFHKVFRAEKGQQQKVFDITGSEILILDKDSKTIKQFSDKDLSNKIVKIFNKIKASEETTFEITEAAEVMLDLLCTRIKADSNTKSDIEAEVLDRITDTVAPLGFSVKSILGGASTLLNAGKTTNFVFEVKDLDKQYIDSINSISTRSKVQDRIKAITEHGGKLIFKNVSRKEFESNLKKIDTVFPSFIAQMLLDFFSGKAIKISDLTILLSTNSELLEKYGLSHSDYEFKVKNFLQSTALGMVPSKIWDGFTKAHGGYIVVRNDGVVICYHLYNRDEFLSYLYENTKLESASTGRHEYGSLYIKEDKILFNLNLQIRFIK